MQDLVNGALKNNPEIKASRKRWEAAKEKIPQVRSLPDPKFSYTYFPESIETKNGPQENAYQLSQKFPSFGKPRLRGEVAAIREATIAAGKRRIRPCLMTAGTTILALIPVLTSTGRGADVMVPMAIPSFGGMLMVVVTVFVAPTLYCADKELNLKFRTKN